jgi:hypothetical protein
VDRVIDYLNLIEMIDRADRQLARRDDATGQLVLQGTLDAAQAAWQLLPAEWQARLEPPPTSKDCGR